MIEHGQLLHYAIRRDQPDHLEVLQFILDKNPDVNRVMYKNCPQSYEPQKAFGIGTPLHEAAEMGKLDVVSILLANEADRAVKDARGETTLDRAERSNRTAVLEYLRRQEYGVRGGSLLYYSEPCFIPGGGVLALRKRWVSFINV